MRQPVIWTDLHPVGRDPLAAPTQLHSLSDLSWEFRRCPTDLPLTSGITRYILLNVKAQKHSDKRKEVGSVRLSLVIDEPTWKALRAAAEEERTDRGRASMNALINRLIAEHLAKRKAKGGT